MATAREYGFAAVIIPLLVYGALSLSESLKPTELPLQVQTFTVDPTVLPAHSFPELRQKGTAAHNAETDLMIAVTEACRVGRAKDLQKCTVYYAEQAKTGQLVE